MNSSTSCDVPAERAAAAAIPAEKLALSVRIANLLAVTLPLAGLATAIVLLWGTGFSWVHLGLLFGMYAATVLGVTVGFHRLFTHRAFETKPLVKAIFAIFGSMAVQGPLLKWVALHRQHHQHSDGEDDPHSPHAGAGQGVIGMLKGMWHAHVGWMFKPDAPDLLRYAADLQKDKLLRWISATFPLWVILGLVIPAVLGGLLTMSWTGALCGFLWGGLARIFLAHHVTWSINSVCHIWGSRPFDSHDESRNNFVFGVLAFGEGWHNNHHAFPRSARHGLRWWEPDVSYWIIRAMAWMHLAHQIRVPSSQAISAKQRIRSVR